MQNELSIPSVKPATEDWGRLYVSRKCIGAAGCRNFAPELLAEVAAEHGLLDDGGSRAAGLPVLPGSYDKGAFTGVVRQPRSKEEYLAARTAAAACPFSAIRLEKPAAATQPGELG